MRQPRRHHSKDTPEQVTHEEGNLRLTRAGPAVRKLFTTFSAPAISVTEV
jgi:hypothetical protein